MPISISANVLALRHSWGRYGSRTTPACLLDSIANAGPDTPTILHPTPPLPHLRPARRTKLPSAWRRSRDLLRRRAGTTWGKLGVSMDPDHADTAAEDTATADTATADPATAVPRGMRALLARRDAALAAGARPVGWKIGFNTPAIQEHFGLTEAVVGYLTDAGVSPPGATIALTGWGVPAVEDEVAIRVGDDGP